MLRSHPEPKTKIRLTLLPALPSTINTVPEPVSPPHKEIAAKRLRKIPAAQSPVQRPKPLQKPTPIPPPIMPHADPRPIAQPSEPVPAKAAAVEPAAVKVPAPPPAITVQANYEEENLGKIRALLSERLKYPKNALRLKQQGDVMIAFTLSPSGDISGLTIIKSSEFELLDEAARELILTTASVFPKPSKNVRISIPIDYKIR